MSSKAISAATTHFLQFRIQYASIALLYYDYTLTFPMEMKYIWKEKLRWTMAPYFFCRYALLANVLYLLAIANKLGATSACFFSGRDSCADRLFRCNSWYKIIGALSVLGRAAVIVTFTMRTYAITGKNRLILAYMSVIGLTCIALDITHVPGLRCVGSSSNPLVNNLLSILMVVFEYSSAMILVYRCILAFKALGPLKSQKNSIFYVMFEQGIFYFGLVSLFTTAAVILNYRAPSGFFQRLLNALTLPLSGLLTARFLLHIRKWDQKRSGDVVYSTSRHADNNGSIGVFRAAGASAAGVLSTIADDFGCDPVLNARADAEERNIDKNDNKDVMEGSSGSGNQEREV